jgi:hypothetical protein
MTLRSAGIIFTIDPILKPSKRIYEESFSGNVKRNMAALSVGVTSAVTS